MFTVAVLWRLKDELTFAKNKEEDMKKTSAKTTLHLWRQGVQEQMLTGTHDEWTVAPERLEG